MHLTWNRGHALRKRLCRTATYVAPWPLSQQAVVLDWNRRGTVATSSTGGRWLVPATPRFQPLALSYSLVHHGTASKALSANSFATGERPVRPGWSDHTSSVRLFSWVEHAALGHWQHSIRRRHSQSPRASRSESPKRALFLVFVTHFFHRNSLLLHFPNFD